MPFYAKDSYTGSGIVGPYSVTFPYISKTHVEVRVGNTLKVVTTDYTWASATTITFVAAVGSGVAIEFKRNTPKTIRLVNFADGGVLTEADLDLDSDQAFYIAQETYDDTTVQTAAAASATAAANSATAAAASATSAATSATNAAISAASINDANIVHKTTDETVGGIKTFTSSPVLPGNATTALQAVPKQQMDAAIAASGSVTSVTGTAPVVSSGGATPAISMAAATASVAGHMSAAYASKLNGIAAGATVGVPQDVGVGGVGAIEMLYSNGFSTTTGATQSGANLEIAVGTVAGALTRSNIPLSGTWRNLSQGTVAATEFGTFQRIS